MNGHWRAHALCAQVDPELWFPEKGGSAAPAKRICFACPVRIECLSYALETGQDDGIWGGHTRESLRQIRREEGIISAGIRILEPCGTPAAYRRHLRSGEPACQACLAAGAASVRTWRYSRAGAS